VTVTQFDGGADPEKQGKEMQDALAGGGYDGWMIYQLGPEAYTFGQEAIQKGVKVVGTLVPFGPHPEIRGPQLKGQLASTFDDFNKIGQNMGTLTVQACKGVDPCKVEYLYGYKFIPFEPVIRAAFDKTTAPHKNITVVASQNGGYL